ncbi:ABC transporter permease [Rhodococcus sp. Leaf278]|uniref:ABC transporter permease n=1 Tax=Rhodococcus sp. Leaf278 TaxID=1736319 RepID=UPI0007095843|nr:ABC transporter permease [Rhodococcus sp. Leaf278]KQU50513.1 ABC transporter permease [Rhodococcus sp. Leaf278]
MTTATSARRLGRGATGVIASAAVFFVLYGLLVSMSPVAGSPAIVSSFLTLATPLAIAAAGTTLVLIVGGFDLSVAGTISLTNVISATAMAANPDNAWLIAAGVLLLGTAIGAVNGVVIAAFGLPPLGVTLATNIVLAGIALTILPAPGGAVPLDFSSALTGSVGLLPVALILLLAVAGLWLVFCRTRTGLATFAVGGDVTSSKLSGINVFRVQVTAYSLAGLLYGTAGLYFSALTGTGSPSSGTSFLLTAFAAAALGLVSFSGGRGSVIAAMFGACILTVIPKLLFAAGVADFWVGALQGLVVLVALCIPWLMRSVAGLTNRNSAAAYPVRSHPPRSETAQSEPLVVAAFKKDTLS